MIITSANMVVSVTTVAICLSSILLSGLTLLFSEDTISNWICFSAFEMRRSCSRFVFSMDKGRLFSGLSMPFCSEEVCLLGGVFIPKCNEGNDIVSSKLVCKNLKA